MFRLRGAGLRIASASLPLLAGAAATTNEGLTKILTNVPKIKQLQLEFYPTYADPPPSWLKQALCSLVSGCLETLELRGDVEDQQGIVAAIVERQPNLKSLAMGVSCDILGPLANLQALEVGRFAAYDCADLRVIESLKTLRTVDIWADRSSGCVLCLQRTVTQLACRGNFFSSVRVPENIEVLTVAIHPADVSKLVALLPTLVRLKSLSLNLSHDRHQARKTQTLLEEASFSCPSVERLALCRFGTYSGLFWILKAFLHLRELEFEDWHGRGGRGRDVELEDVFGLCPELQTVKDVRCGSTVTVGKREDGRLVRREQGARTLL